MARIIDDSSDGELPDLNQLLQGLTVGKKLPLSHSLENEHLTSQKSQPSKIQSPAKTKNQTLLDEQEDQDEGNPSTAIRRAPKPAPGTARRQRVLKAAPTSASLAEKSKQQDPENFASNKRDEILSSNPSIRQAPSRSAKKDIKFDDVFDLTEDHADDGSDAAWSHKSLSDTIDESESDCSLPSLGALTGTRPNPMKSQRPLGNIRLDAVALKSPSKGDKPQHKPADPFASESFRIPRPSTPTQEPASPSKSRLTSPSKKKNVIPPTPHRPNLDAFWNVDVVNNWNDQHSPRKTIKFSPLKQYFANDSGIGMRAGSSDLESNESLVPVASPKKAASKSPSKAQAQADKDEKKEAAKSQKQFDHEKERLGDAFLQELDDRITDGEIGRLAASTGGVKIVWSRKLNTTAGRANWRREAVTQRSTFSTSSTSNTPDLLETQSSKTSHTATSRPPTTTYRNIASIELAEKLIKDRLRLYDVLAHEYCHLANFMISHVLDQPHGAFFRKWASRVTATFGASHGVKVTTKHEYKIDYKFVWLCDGNKEVKGEEEGCGMEYGRHSRSLDPKRHRCGRCSGRLVQVKPRPKGGKAGSGDGAKTASGNNYGPSNGGGYQAFVKEHFARVKEDLPPGSPMKNVMKEVGARYREDKSREKGKAMEHAEAPAPPVFKGKKDDVTTDVVEVTNIDDRGDEDDDQRPPLDMGSPEEKKKHSVTTAFDDLTI